MDKAKVDKVAEQEAAVTAFLKEHRPILKEEELSFAVLETIYVQGAALLKSVSDDLEKMAKPTVAATNALTAALNERPRVAPKIARLEKKRNRLKADFERVNVLFNQLEPFLAKVKHRLDAEYEEDGTPKTERTNYEVFEAYDQSVRDAHAVRSAKEAPNKLPWWKRLLGVHQEESLNTPTLRPGTPVHEYSLLSGPRESPLKPSETETNRRDYEKFLGFYSQVMTHLENMVRMRAQDGQNYTPDQDQRWKAQWDEQVDNMAWADDNMDAIEDRNAEVARSELVERRENLASRRAELENN